MALKTGAGRSGRCRLNRSYSADRGTPIPLFSPMRVAIILISWLWLADFPARGQQSYIPWSSGLETRHDAPAVETTESNNLDRRRRRRRLGHLPDQPPASRTSRKVRPAPSTMVQTPMTDSRPGCTTLISVRSPRKKNRRQVAGPEWRLPSIRHRSPSPTT